MTRQGVFSFIKDGNILISKLDGAISLRDTELAFEQLKIHVRQFAGAPWANLIDTRQWGLNAADIDEALMEIETWVRKNGRTHRVFIIGIEYAELKRFSLEKYLGDRLKKNRKK